MPNLDNLTDSMSQSINDSDTSHTTKFTKLNMQYAYSHFNRYPDMACHCKPNLIDDSINTFRLKKKMFSSIFLHSIKKAIIQVVSYRSVEDPRN